MRFIAPCTLYLTIDPTGVGALLSPLSATYFAQVPHWSYHYLTCLGITVVNTIFLLGVFRLRRQEGWCATTLILLDLILVHVECLAEIGIMDTEERTGAHSPVRQILALKDVHLLAAFILCYVGAEVALGGTCLLVTTFIYFPVVTGVARMDRDVRH